MKIKEFTSYKAEEEITILEIERKRSFLPARAMKSRIGDSVRHLCDKTESLSQPHSCLSLPPPPHLAVATPIPAARAVSQCLAIKPSVALQR